jgi:polygalacturonase
MGKERKLSVGIDGMRCLFYLLFVLVPPLSAEVFLVQGPRDLACMRSLKDGDVLRISHGTFPAGHYISGIANLTVEGTDPKNPPVFEGGNEAFHFSRTPGLKLRNIIVKGQKSNGINIDDGGKRDEPVEGILIENVKVEDIGPTGNFDGIKCSGLKDLVIRDCEVSGWGGQAIDFVGCRDALITGCTITGKPGFSQNTGPQFKGGSENVTIEKCHFVNAGERPIQAGGSTGKEFFRPPGANYEARRIFIRDNVIEGGVCATAFTGVTDAEFTGNKIIRPTKWIFRILQETRKDGFKPCGNVKISNNEFIFREEEIRTEINIGDGTAPETFVFENNRWFAEDHPSRLKPKFPLPSNTGH